MPVLNGKSLVTFPWVRVFHFELAIMYFTALRCTLVSIERWWEALKIVVKSGKISHRYSSKNHLKYNRQNQNKCLRIPKMALPLQQASAVEPQSAAAVVWPSLAVQKEWVPHVDFQPNHTQGYGQNGVIKGREGSTDHWQRDRYFKGFKNRSLCQWRVHSSHQRRTMKTNKWDGK